MKTKAPTASPRELIFTTTPDAGLRVRGEKVISLKEGVGVKPLTDMLVPGHVAIRPLFGDSEESLKERTARTNVRMGVGQPLDLSIFYKVTAPDTMLEELAVRLRKMSCVQSAYIKPGVELPVINHDLDFLYGIAPDMSGGGLTSYQVYLNAASAGGVDARHAWDKQGGGGDGVNIIDIEGAWYFDHEDLKVNQGRLVGGVEIIDADCRNHGTAVLGVLGGDRNSLGITGICPEAMVRTVSVFGNSYGIPVEDWGPAEAIRHAADRLGKGDIILIEHHMPGPPRFQVNRSQIDYIPVEWWPCNMAAIQYATDKGIIVVEAGGNGRCDLDLSIYNENPSAIGGGPFPQWWRNPFAEGSIDTKAIMVGAGAPPASTYGGNISDRSRLEFSNYGSRFDVQGWGDWVATSGYGGLPINHYDESRWYTGRFSGTSSAAAMVAGVIGSLQGFLRAKGIYLNSAEIRALLRNNSFNAPQTPGPYGTPVEKFRIGPRPDLYKLLDYLSRPESLLLRAKALLRTNVVERLRRLLGT